MVTFAPKLPSVLGAAEPHASGVAGPQGSLQGPPAVCPQMQYTFIYQALLEYHLYGDTELDVSSLEKHLQTLQGTSTRFNKMGLEEEFRVSSRLTGSRDGGSRPPCPPRRAREEVGASSSHREGRGSCTPRCSRGPEIACRWRQMLAPCVTELRVCSGVSASRPHRVSSSDRRN